MTREKLTALQHILQRLEEEYKNYLDHGETNTQAIETEIEAVKEAISALSAKPCEEEECVTKKAIKHCIELNICEGEESAEHYKFILDELMALPPAQSEEKRENNLSGLSSNATLGDIVLAAFPDFMKNTLLISNEEDFKKFAELGKNLVRLEDWNTPCKKDCDNCGKRHKKFSEGRSKKDRQIFSANSRSLSSG